MALKFFESFDLPQGWATYTTADWCWVNGTYAWSRIASIGRRGTYAARSSGSSFASTLSIHADAEYSELIVGFAADFVEIAAKEFLYVTNVAGNTQFSLRVNLDGSIDVLTGVAGSTLASSSAGVFTFSQYVYMEIKFTCTGTDTIEIRIDETTVLSASGLNLQQAGSGSAKQINFRNKVSGTLQYFYLDDVYVCDTSGSSFKDFLGDVKVDAFLPTSDGHYAELTPSVGTDHYAMVDDVTDTNYVSSSIVGLKDSFGLTISGDLPTIHAVGVVTYARNPDTGQAGTTPFWRIGGTDYEMSENLFGNTLVSTLQISFGNPMTGSVWTKPGLETAELGIEFSSAT